MTQKYIILGGPRVFLQYDTEKYSIYDSLYIHYSVQISSFST